MATIRVNMAELVVAESPDILETQALGSCVGVVLYDQFVKVGGLAHAMLADIKFSKESGRLNKGKFVNSAIEELVEKMMKLGAKKEHIKAKLVGGANMFPGITRLDSMHIGKRNLEAARIKLDELGIPISAEETGGSVGRTISFDTNTGRVKVHTALHGDNEI